MTDVPLRDYFEQRFTDHLAVHAAERREVDKAHTVIEGRLKELNNLRSEVTSDRGQYVLREVYDNAHEQLRQQISDLDNWRSKATGIGLVLVLISGIVGAAVMRALGG